MGHAISLLHSADLSTVRRTLGILHVKFWHAPAEILRTLFGHAGAPKTALDMVKQVVDTCSVCRLWTRPSAKRMTVTRLASGFNGIVQADTLFVERLKISHCIDEATRWCAGGVIDDREGSTMTKSLTMHWIRQFGAMKLLVTDQEPGVRSEEASTWLSRQNPIQDQRAWIPRANRRTTPRNITPTRTPCAGSRPWRSARHLRWPHARYPPDHPESRAPQPSAAPRPTPSAPCRR